MVIICVFRLNLQDIIMHCHLHFNRMGIIIHSVAEMNRTYPMVNPL